ncbi:Major facilitator superfamily domain-containing protein 8 [Seminavis robusta]|uniref:Major facilitator superfamily domain-containing protein 8 n=1 Tax=Seminavis robusta TaxID=568900 RepID=A0A9N8EJR3_9STRA|nr:Major facilitator superfamily domain-containing protein 8 [Seminavis robusta]|eukprot:Sro1215_g253150.1 Major facilitator superfamily domain-containing protein 8 (520) ;mRNA; r:6102-7820
MSSSGPIDLLSGDAPAIQPAGDEEYSAPPSRGSPPRSSAPYVAMEIAGARLASPGMPDQFQNEYKNGDDDDNKSVDMSSVLTADGIHDVPGFCVVCLVILIGDMSRGAMFPSMWPLVEKLGGDRVTLGYAVAAFSFGRILVNPVFGSWSHTWGYTNTLLLSTSLLLFGTFCYSQVLNVGRPEFLIVAQTMLGVGSGTLGVTRAFVADVTAKRSRTTYMAWVTAVQYGGFTVTPFVGAFFNKVLGEDTDVHWGLFRFNMYTAPAYFMAVVIAFVIAMLLAFFQDRQRISTVKEQPKRKSQRRAYIDDVANSFPSWLCGLCVYDACILGCMLLNVSTKGSIASFETLGISFAESHFQMASSRAGTIVASSGLVGVCALLSFGYLTQWFSDVQLIKGGMAIMATGIVSLAFLSEDSAENNNDDNPTWRYVSAIFLIYGIGYPVGHTAVIGLFSKVVGRRPQGALMGWFASAGSLARILFPVLSGYIAHYSDMSTLFILLTCVLTISIIFVFMSRETLTLLSS